MKIKFLKEMFLKVVSPDETLYKGEVSLVQMPGEMGSFEVLNNHAPIVALLETGKIKVIDKQRNRIFLEIKGGVVHVRDNNITIVTSA